MPNHFDPMVDKEIRTDYLYDAFHRPLARKDEMGAIYAIHRDGEGNIIKEIPHVHQPVRNVTPNGMIFGRTGKDVGIDVFSPNKKDIKQLYEYLNNGKYHE